jgi:transcriptional regulator with AAA-type ATPase domain
LSEAFLQDLGRAFGRPPAGISLEARDALLAYAWPGNVRELRNMLERAAILCEGGLILAEHLAFQTQVQPQSQSAPPPLQPAQFQPQTRAAGASASATDATARMDERFDAPSNARCATRATTSRRPPARSASHARSSTSACAATASNSISTVGPGFPEICVGLLDLLISEQVAQPARTPATRHLAACSPP